ncbi:unnamed protein product, partial [Musa acuminata subsp. malaccensis]
MAEKLGKLKCMLKRWHSRSRLHAGSPSAAVRSHDDENSPTDLHPVYVGKSRRRYLISSDLVGHLSSRSSRSDPLTQTVQRSSSIARLCCLSTSSGCSRTLSRRPSPSTSWWSSTL